MTAFVQVVMFLVGLGLGYHIGKWKYSKIKK